MPRAAGGRYKEDGVSYRIFHNRLNHHKRSQIQSHSLLSNRLNRNKRRIPNLKSSRQLSRLTKVKMLLGRQYKFTHIMEKVIKLPMLREISVAMKAMVGQSTQRVRKMRMRKRTQRPKTQESSRRVLLWSPRRT